MLARTVCLQPLVYTYMRLRPSGRPLEVKITFQYLISPGNMYSLANCPPPLYKYDQAKIRVFKTGSWEVLEILEILIQLLLTALRQHTSLKYLLRIFSPCHSLYHFDTPISDRRISTARSKSHAEVEHVRRLIICARNPRPARFAAHCQHVQSRERRRA